ncbi:hypothetical protein KY334_02860 [Candidatus Woesearchaeota archaeon]|nr:hypothetical protein [Candidatus Woesearchaeota archaeon]
MLFNKKAQLTIFVIIAILLLFSFMFVFYQISSQKDNELRNQRIENNLDGDSEVFEESIQSCLQRASVDALNLLGSQGGVYYFNQEIETYNFAFLLNGIYDESKFIEINDEKFLLLIEKRDLVEYNDNILPQRQYFTPPHYPCRSKITSPIASLIQYDVIRDYPGCQTEYSINKEIESLSVLTKLPSLCNRKVPEDCEENCDCSCVGNCENTIMSELEDYVGKYFKSCIFDLVPDGYSLETQNFDIKIRVGRDLIYFELDEVKYIDIKNEDFVLRNIKSDNIHLNLFSFFDDSFNIMIAKESTIPDFNLTRGILDLDFVNPEIIIIPNVLETEDGLKEYDLIKIKLNEVDANLNGKPFYFNFVRENRMPVLQYINKVNIPDSRKYAFTFKAVDPDEDTLRIIPTTYDKIDIKSITPDTTEKNKWIVAFESNIGKFNTETIRLDVCDSMYCDYQTIELRQE